MLAKVIEEKHLIKAYNRARLKKNGELGELLIIFGVLGEKKSILKDKRFKEIKDMVGNTSFTAKRKANLIKEQATMNKSTDTL